IVGGLLALMLILTMTVIALPVWLESQAVEALQLKIDEVEPEAKKIKAMQLEIDTLTEHTKLLLDEKTARPPLVVLLNALSTLIKDDTSLTYAQYSDGHLQMQGESASASGLISLLEASDYFANARFVSPVTQDKVTGLERFQITVDATKPAPIEPKAELDAGNPQDATNVEEAPDASEDPQVPLENRTDNTDATKKAGGSDGADGK
ncbi:MAG: PilN domain-containing protein, partial [Methylobacter sp.]|nr:PilN domain-containing protein [Methylobacter sp.]